MEFRILGPLEVRREGDPVRLRGPRLRALLAILLLHRNEVVSTDQLIEDLWDGRPPPNAKELVWVHVSRLRKTLGGDALLSSSPPGYILRVQADELDLGRFERLVAEARGAEPAVASERLHEALALWRGPPLADVRYEQFAATAISRLEELRLAALEARIDADLALGRHTELVGELEALVAENPLQERLRAQLMLALYRAGRQAEALAAYQEARRALVEELGLEPTPELQKLERAILAQDPSLVAPRASSSADASRAIVAAAREESHLRRLLELAAPMAAADPSRELILLRVLPPARRSELTVEVARMREAAAQEGDATVRIAAFASCEVASDVVRFASQQGAELLLLEADLGSLLDGLESDLAEMLANAPCDVALLVAAESAEIDRHGPIVVPFGAARHDWAALELGALLARARSAPLVLVGALAARGGSEQDASRLLADASILVQRCSGVVAEPLLTTPGPDGFLAAASEAALSVIGLSDRGAAMGLGETRRTIAEKASAPVIFVRRGIRPGGLAPAETRTRFTWSLATAAT